MERKKNKLEKFTTLFLVVIFAVGIIGHLNDYTRKLMLFLTPFTLLFAMGIVFYTIRTVKNRKLLIWLISTYVFTLFIEILGVKTGIIFGNYVYGDTLGVKFIDVPLLIGMNWVFVILGAFVIARRITSDNKIIVFVTASLSVMFDFILEPVAVKLNYWRWENELIPLQNYVAWFVISLFASYFFVRNNIEIDCDLPQNYLIVQAIFFISLNLFL